MRNAMWFLLAAGSLTFACPAFAACVGMALKSAPENCASTLFKVPEGRGKTFQVGPGHAYPEAGDVPWFSLAAGDTVYIHHREKPYRTKILISARGTPDQWVRLIGVAGPNGELPVISGDRAETTANVHYRWEKPDIIEWLGVIQVAIGLDSEEGTAQEPAYIEIANLQVQDAFLDYKFRASNGAWLNYDSFSACIYTRSVDHMVVRNSILTNCGLGFYNWTGDGSVPVWSALQYSTVISGNHFYNNGTPGSYLEHQVYTESKGVTIEYNRFGPQRAGAYGSQIKDRSVGTVIRYNRIEQSDAGWDIDLVEPEESYLTLGPTPQAKQTFVYGNVIVSNGVSQPNIVHWNEDHQAGRGRATMRDGRLHFYHNTIVMVPAREDSAPYALFNGTWGGYECEPSQWKGAIDVRNNIFAMLPERSAWSAPIFRMGYCRHEIIRLGKNWITPGAIRDKNVIGWSNVVEPASNDPGFMSAGDFRLKEGASAARAAGELAPDVSANSLGLDLLPRLRFVDELKLEERPSGNAPLDLGAY